MATTAKSAKDSKESTIPVMPTIESRPASRNLTAVLGFVSALVFDGQKDHNGKQVSSHVWLAIPLDPKSKSVGSVYLGEIIDGRYHPTEDWQAVDVDLAAMLFPSTKKNGPEQQDLSAILDREIRAIARSDYDETRSKRRSAQAFNRESKAKTHLELVKSMIG